MPGRPTTPSQSQPVGRRPSLVIDRFFVFSRKATVAVFVVLVGLLIIDLLSSRQSILKFDDTLETVYFVLTIAIGWGIGSWLFLGYVGKITAELRARSFLIRLLHVAVTIIQFALLGLLLYVMFDRSVEFLTQYVFAITAVAATVIMGVFSIKFFSWYGTGRKSNGGIGIMNRLTVLLYALATTGLAFSIMSDFAAKTFLVQVIEEETPAGTVTEETFPFKDVEQGRILAQNIRFETTTTYLVPNEYKYAYHLIGLIPPYFSFFFRWAATSVTLRQYYHMVGRITFWSLISIPLILYGIGKIPDFFDAPDELWQRIIYRIGSIGGNIMFGVTFFVVARKASPPVKDYLSIAAIGFTIIGIAFSIMGLQQTFGVAGHSLVLLSAYLFTIGLYATAISVSHDVKLRQYIMKSASNELRLPGSIGKAQMEQEVQKKVVSVARNTSHVMTEQSGIQSSLEEEDMKRYLEQVIKEIRIGHHSYSSSKDSEAAA